MDDHEISEIVKLAGGPRFDPYKKHRLEAEKIKKANFAGSSPFVIEKASAEQQTTVAPQQPLYGDFWRTGELAVLIGESGIGKSLLATQIAEVIARGSQDSINGLPTATEPRNVIYFDFGRTREQFGRTYSCQPFDDEPDYWQEYNFSTNFDLARIEIVTDIPDRFKGSVDRYIRHWLFDEIAESQSGIFIIDSIEHLSIGTKYETLMRSLRYAASASGSSLLVVARSKPTRRPSEITLADVAQRAAITDEADTVFTIARSITHPDVRYVKDLKSRSTQLTAHLPAALAAELSPADAEALSLTTSRRSPTTAPAAVLTYKIERLSSPLTTNHSQLTTNSTALQLHPSSFRLHPFLGLRYLTLSLESHHLPVRNSAVRTPHSAVKRLPSSRTAIVNGLLDGSYGKYMLGE
jgi:hypothetical protein